MAKNIISIISSPNIRLYASTLLAAFFVRCGFPGISIPVMAILGYAIFIECIRVSKRPCITGIVFGSTFNMSLCSWIYKTLVIEFQFNFFSAFLFYFFIIGIALSCFYAIFAAVTHQLILKNLTHKGKFNNYSIIISVASVFVFLEWLRVSFSPEYGWAQLATIFYKTPPVFVTARWFGGSGIAFLTLVLSGFVWNIFFTIRNKNYKQAVLSTSLLFFIAIGVWTFGVLWLSVQSPEEVEAVIEVKIIHSGIEQSRRWKQDYYKENLNVYNDLSLSAFEDKSEKTLRLIVWPETSLATYELQNNGELAQVIKTFCKKNDAWLIAGLPSYEKTKTEKKYFNSAFLVSPGGHIKGRYDKKHLLPFAERKFSFIEFKNRQRKKSYSPGSHNEVLLIKDKNLNNGVLYTGVAICYEAGITSHISKAAMKKMRILINISNDAWFSNSSESEQQLSMIALRCVENGVPGIRGTGYGVAAIIDKYGRIEKKTDITGESVLSGRIKIPELPKTLQRSYKDWFVILCMLLIFFLFGVHSRK